MSFDTNWDIEKYRTIFESVEHWELKKDFMLAHKDRFPEDRLICLAQVFVNIELLGCKYPDKVMEQVAVLSKDLGKDYRQNKQNRLKRTFIKASDAANSKVRGSKSLPISENFPNKRKVTDRLTYKGSEDSVSTNITQNVYSPLKETHSYDFAHYQQHISSADLEDYFSGKKSPTIIESIPSESPRDLYSENLELQQALERILNDGNPLSKIILIARSACMVVSNVIQSSLDFNKIQYEYKFNVLGELHTDCTLILNGREFITVKANNKKQAKLSTSVHLFDKLRSICFFVKVKHSEDREHISLNQLKGNTSSTSNYADDDNKISDNSIGARLLKSMGWGGGGLGKSGDGIVEPVKAVSVIGRSGLGVTTENVADGKFKKNVFQILKDYFNDTTSSDRDLYFSDELSNDQRKAIHLIVRTRFRNKLKSHSTGKGSSRKLTISRIFSNEYLLQNLINEGGETDKYRLYPPGKITFK